MNKEFIKRLTLAHGWLGLIFSGLLFIIFFAGSIALFRQEITNWSMQPHFPVTQGKQISVERALDIALKGRDYDAKEHITLVLPSAENRYFQAVVDIKNRPVEPHYDYMHIDPVSGKIVSEGGQFELAEFIYHLHYDLNIPQGKYILGFVTLFFLFALISGIFIHARKFFSNFFQYRAGNHKRSQLLDMHNVVGVVSLPFTIMYAISGLIFNLVIIYQVAFAITVYKGDGEALLKDAGFATIAPVWQDKPASRINLDELIQDVTDDYQLAPRTIRLYNYGDESGLVQLFSKDNSQLTVNYNNAYALTTGEMTIQSDSRVPNSLVVGTGVLRKLHYGNYASLDLRLVYLFLGFAVCALIITGNLLWLEKREKQRNFSARTLTIARYVTLVSSAGIMVSTAMAFIVERLMPATLAERGHLIGTAFWSFLALCALVYALPMIRRNYRLALQRSLYLCGVGCVVAVVIGYVLYGKTMLALINAHDYSTLAVDIALIISAIVLSLVAKKLNTTKIQAEDESSEESSNLAAAK